MAYLPSRAEIAFEQNKDDGRVQAILKALGKMREQVSDWSLDHKKNTYTVVFWNGDEMRGEALWVWQHQEWIASGTLVPKEVVQMERFHLQQEQKQGE